MPDPHALFRSPHPSRPAPHAAALAVAAALAGVLPPLAAQTAPPLAAAAPAAAQPVRRHAFHIAAGPLAPALRSLAGSAGIALSFTADQAGGKNTAGLQGEYSVVDAFARLLEGSGMQAVQMDNGGYVLRPLPSPAPAGAGQRGGPERMLPTVTIVGTAEQEQARGRVDGYAARRSASGTKTDSAILETPQSLTVITSDQIAAQGAQTLRDTIGYTPGVGAQTNGYRDTDNLMLRGFQVDNGSIRRDGLRSPSNTFTGTQETYGLERVEILRGAASLLYGAAEPGGLINLVTKRPSATSWHEAGVELGSHRRRQASADFTDKVDGDSGLAYRLTLLKRDSGTFIDGVPDDRVYIAPALSWSGNDTVLTLLSHYQKSRLNRQWGVEPEGSLLPNPHGVIAPGMSIGEPGDHREDEHKSLALLLERHLSPQATLNVALRRTQVDLDWAYAGRDGLRDDLRTLNRYHALRMEKVSAWTGDANLQLHLETGPLHHRVLAGVDGSSARAQRTRHYRLLDPLDIFQPVYGAQPHGDDGRDGYRETTRSAGVYVQDQIGFGTRWIALLGARRDHVKIARSDYFDEDWSAETSRATTGRAGIVYLADNGLAPFASASTSFQPVGGTDRLGRRFKPGKGEQFEAGLRYQPAAGNALLSAAVYQLTQSNVEVPDPVDPDNYSVQTGEIRARGMELEARGDLTRRLRVVAAYTYTDAKTTRAGPTQAGVLGQRQANTPRNQLSAWGDYALAQTPGLRAGAGLRYVGSTLGSGLPYRVPAFTVLDAGLSYDTGPWRLRLNAKNLANKAYLAECGAGYCNYGDPRQLAASAQYRW